MKLFAIITLDTVKGFMMQMRYMLRCFGTTIILVVILAVDGLLFSSASAKTFAADCLLLTGRVYAPNASPHGVPYRGILDIHTGALTPIENSIRLERYTEGTSPDGRYTAYYERYLTATTASEVVSIVDNSNGTSLPLQPQGGDVHWSPDSRWLAYITRRQDNLTRYALVIASADGRAAHIVDLKDVDGIQWSPDSAYVAVKDSLVRVNDLNVYLAPAQGSMELSLSSHHVAYTWNGLIDNGASIADSLRLVDLDTAAEQTFHLNAEERFGELVWSPDERYVAVNVFAPSQPNHFRLDIYGMDGSKRIGVGAVYSQDVPVWSSDGRYLMFTESEPLSLATYEMVSGQTELFVSNLVPSTVQGNVLVDSRSGQTDFVAVQRSAHDGAYRILYIQGKHVTPLMENLSHPPVLRSVFKGKTILVATQQPTGYTMDMIDIHTRQRHSLLSGLVQAPQFKWGDENSNQTAFWWKTQTATGLDSYNADGSRAYRLKAVLSPIDDVSGTEIFWSPDHRLALLSIRNRDGEANWQLATSDGQSVRMLGNGYKYGHAVWSSDSMNIAMEAQSSAGSDIRIVDTRHSDDRRFVTPVSLETMVWTECLL